MENTSPWSQLFHTSRQNTKFSHWINIWHVQNYGICVATCVICNQQYCMLANNKQTFQTVSIQKKPEKNIRHDSDQMAFSWHYAVICGILNKPPIYGSYTIAFVVLPSFDSCQLVMFNDIFSISLCPFVWPLSSTHIGAIGWWTQDMSPHQFKLQLYLLCIAEKIITIASTMYKLRNNRTSFKKSDSHHSTCAVTSNILFE